MESPYFGPLFYTMTSNSFFAKLIIITCLITMTTGFSFYRSLFPFHVSMPIDLSRAGSVAEVVLNIQREDRYKFSLEFMSLKERAPIDTHLRTILGDLPYENPIGITIPIRMTIVKLQAKEQLPVIDKIFNTKGVSGIAEKTILRDFTVLSLQPGEYKLRIESIGDFPELTQVPITLNIIYFFAK